MQMGGAEVNGIDDLAAVMESTWPGSTGTATTGGFPAGLPTHDPGRFASGSASPSSSIPPGWSGSPCASAGTTSTRWSGSSRGDDPPPAWAYAFDIAARKRAFLLQDILLGMNAHINNDLPLVVAEILHAEGDERSVFGPSGAASTTTRSTGCCTTSSPACRTRSPGTTAG